MFRKSLSESEPGRRVRVSDRSRVDDVSNCFEIKSASFCIPTQVKEGSAEEERHLITAGEERAEARARVMMAASRLQPSLFEQKLNGERSTSVRGEERLMMKAGEERLKMSERQPLESVSLVMRAGERPNATGERFSREERSAGERHLKEVFQGERHMKDRRGGEADSDRGSSVDTTDDSGRLFFKAL